MRRLAHDIGVEESEYGDFRSAVRELMRAGRVVWGGGNLVTLPDAAEKIIGRFRGHARGFGFVVPESPTEHGDLFIPPGSTRDAITGDTVLARITRRDRDDRARVEGEIVEILQRGQNRFVGELVRQGSQWMMRPDGHALHTPILLGDVSSTRARAGDQIVAELTEFPSPPRPGRGVIVEVLGRRGAPGVDTLSVIRQYQFPEDFPAKVLEDARDGIRSYDVEREIGRREDLREEVVITIDPDEAKDFDDAISIRRSPRGIELGVHIADVSHFVRTGHPLDTEAKIRGNSVYLPRHVIPMLPEVLSNGLCSLQQDEPRLTKTAFITYDATGRRRRARFANTIIQSRRRLTYREATAILEGKAKESDREVLSLLREMNHLARLIQKRRLRAGMVVLEMPEVDLVFNDDDEVTGVEPTDTSFSHTIIEMFMVEANEVASEVMADLGVPHLRRIHPDPPPDAQTKLARFLAVIGQPVPKKMERADIMRLLASVHGKPASFAVNLAVLRSMAPAEYSPAMIGHYALASTHYAHFTSPIRRYPDLVLHRLLDLYLQGKLRGAGRRAAPSAETLAEIGRHCSYTERRAEDAERELKMVKILRFLQGQVGEIEDGVVTGVTNIGVFVQLRRYLVDGLVRFSDLPDDWWDLDPSGGCVVGQRSGKRIAIGQALRVQIAAVDLAIRQLNLALAEGAEETLPHGRGSSSRPTRRQQQGRPQGARRTRTTESQPRGERSRGSSAGRGRRRR